MKARYLFPDDYMADLSVHVLTAACTFLHRTTSRQVLFSTTMAVTSRCATTMCCPFQAVLLKPTSIRAFSLSYGEEFGSATDIDSVNEYSSTLDASWYALQGVPLDGKPTEKGIYIYNGKKVMIK